MDKGCFYILPVALIFSGMMFISSFAGEPQADKNIIESIAGEEVVITLDSNKTTGYGWELAEPLDKDMLQLVSSEYIPEDTGRVGAGGKEVWVFKALRAGKAPISFKYVRPWENDTPAADKKVFVILTKE